MAMDILMMTVKYKMVLTILGSIVLSSCSNHSNPPRTKIVDSKIIKTNNDSNITILTENAINGDVIEDTDNNLNIVYKSENAKVIGLKTLQFAAMLLGGGSGNIDGYSKEQLKGEYIASVKNMTMNYLEPEIITLLNDLSIPSGTGYEIVVQPYKFKLIYDEIGSDKYEFRYSAIIRAGIFQHVCSSSNLISTERIRPISEWEKNNFELTQVMAKKIIKSCIHDFDGRAERDRLTKALIDKKSSLTKV